MTSTDPTQTRLEAVLQYRPYQPGDFPQLYAIEEVCFQPPLRFSRRYMRDLVARPGAATWIAEEDSSMAGFAVVDFAPEPQGTIAYIQTIEVLPAHRNRGIGAGLIRRMEDSALAVGAALIWLHVDAENDAAIRLYRAHGYQRQGRQDHYYARGRAAEIYVKPLQDAG